MPRSILPSAPLAVAVLAVALAAAPAAAQQQSPYEQCLGKAKGTAGSLACAKTELARQEARLKAAGAKIEPTLSPAAKPLYAAASDAWLKFRDAQCAWDRATAGKGDDAAFAETDCKVGMTESRASELEARMAPPEDTPPKK